MYIPPPHLKTPARPSYAETYNRILADHRRAPLSSAASVAILVATDVDALCAARMLAELFAQDDVMHRVIPINNPDKLKEVAYYDLIENNPDLRTLIFLGMGANHNMYEWFKEVESDVTIHIIDSLRPWSLANLYVSGVGDFKVVCWDDGGAEEMEKDTETFQKHPDLLLQGTDPDEEGSDDESDLSDEEDDEEEEEYDEESEGDSPSSRKRRPSGEGRLRRKRRKVDDPRGVSREEKRHMQEFVDKYYSHGHYHGQSCAGTIYILANILERVDNEMLWLAIMGLTHQYITSRISRQTYDNYHSIFDDEVARLNPPLLPTTLHNNTSSMNPEDNSIRATNEFRFMLFRHWTLYDAMFHSSYVASKLGIWKERGRKRLTGLLAKMGFSIAQTQQTYVHMDMNLKNGLKDQLSKVAPEYGLDQLSYPSFVRSYGMRGQPLSAADAVEAASALIALAGGVRMEVDDVGARNGGEWFGGGHVWEIVMKDRDAERMDKRKAKPGAEERNDEEEEGDKADRLDWWTKNFWAAYDALGETTTLRKALSLSMSLHKAIIRQGTSIIDKQDIRTMRGHRVVVLTQGPDLELFSHPRILERLALWLVEAMRDRIDREKQKSLPVVVACLSERRQRYVVVGITASLHFDSIKANTFMDAFQEAAMRANAEAEYISFDSHVMDVGKDNFGTFLQALCEAGS